MRQYNEHRSKALVLGVPNSTAPRCSLARFAGRPRLIHTIMPKCPQLCVTAHPLIQRTERDSNPRYPKGYAGFQNRCLKPDSAIRPGLTNYTEEFLTNEAALRSRYTGV